MKRLLIAALTCLTLNSSAQHTQNVIFITSDGLRWQEIFKGMDKEIADNDKFNQDRKSEIYDRYFDADPLKSREKIFPFFWTQIAKQGQLYGNRQYKNEVNVVNKYHFSYPGYNEMLTGYPDKNVDSNKPVMNKNTTVLEFINQQPGFKGRVAAFTAWDAFRGILNKERSRLPVFSAYDNFGGDKPNAQEVLLNKMLNNSYKPWGWAECLDVYTHYGAFEYLKKNKPRVMYISYGETDEWAHHGDYLNYLDAAKLFDQYVAELWTWLQSQPQYKNKTTLVITTDHGRGDRTKSKWTSHGSEIAGADEIWLAVLGPDTPAKGEVTEPMKLRQEQIAQTLASFLNLKFTADHPVAEAIGSVKR